MKKIACFVLILLTLVCGGCNSVQATLEQLRAELREDVLSQQDVADNTMNDTLKLPEITDIDIEETYQSVQTTAAPNIEQIAVALYYADADGKKLVKEEKQIPKVSGIARATLEALLVGPEKESGLLSAIPSGTSLLDINVKPDGVCIVDFSEELADDPANGIEEELTVYAITNTLCQFPSIEQVEFRVEGESVKTLNGKVDLAKTVMANMEVVKQ